MLALFSTPGALILLIATAVAVRLRHQWIGAAVVLGWTTFVTLTTTADLTIAARQIGCMGTPALFMGAVAAICIGIVMYTAPLKGSSD